MIKISIYNFSSFGYDLKFMWTFYEMSVVRTKNVLYTRHLCKCDKWYYCLPQHVGYKCTNCLCEEHHTCTWGLGIPCHYVSLRTFLYDCIAKMNLYLNCLQRCELFITKLARCQFEYTSEYSNVKFKWKK